MTDQKQPEPDTIAEALATIATKKLGYPVDPSEIDYNHESDELYFRVTPPIDPEGGERCPPFCYMVTVDGRLFEINHEELPEPMRSSTPPKLAN